LTHEEMMITVEKDVGEPDDLLLGRYPKFDEGEIPQIRSRAISAFTLVLLIRLLTKHRCFSSPSVIVVIPPVTMLTSQSEDVECVTLILHVGDDYTAGISSWDRRVQVQSTTLR
jgi:hypothetical protein